MPNELFISMPYLHPDLNKNHRPGFNKYHEKVKYFWPGHARLEAASPWWRAKNLPLSEGEAASILTSLQNHDLHDLERIRLLMQQRLHEEDRQFRTEMRDLERFLAFPESPPEKSDMEAPLRQAQINLLWLWLQEEEYLEIDSLARSCSNAETRLLAEVHDHTEPGFPPELSVLQTARELLPDWQKVFLNAAFFIDTEIPILLEGSMRDDLLAEFSFEIVNSNNDANALILKRTELPLWQILGREHKKHDTPLLDNVWNKPRAFYAWTGNKDK